MESITLQSMIEDFHGRVQEGSHSRAIPHRKVGAILPEVI